MNASLLIEAFGQTDIGKCRTINQDAMLVDKELGLFVVSDGMGGHKAGEVASTLAVQILWEVVTSHLKGEKKEEALDRSLLMVKAFQRVNEQIHFRSQQESALEGMGATLTAILIDGEDLHLAHVGDSRAYLIRENLIWQLTDDHTVVAAQIRAGLLPGNMQFSKYQSSAITRSVGFEESVEVDTLTRTIEVGDVYLLCSDGLSGMLKDREIVQVISEMKPPESVEELIRLSNERGGDDNITAVMVEVRDVVRKGGS